MAVASPSSASGLVHMGGALAHCRAGLAHRHADAGPGQHGQVVQSVAHGHGRLARDAQVPASAASAAPLSQAGLMTSAKIG